MSTSSELSLFFGLFNKCFVPISHLSMRATYPAHLIIIYFITSTSFGEVQIMELVIKQLSPDFRHFFPPTSKYCTKSYLNYEIEC
jgi:hypothetical protein